MPAKHTLSAYIVVTEDGHICKACERRRDAEEWTVAFSRTLGERIRIKRLNPFGDGYTAIGVCADPGDKRVKREAWVTS